MREALPAATLGAMNVTPQVAAPTAPAGERGWAGLFASAFRESRNPMVLLDGRRQVVDVNGAYLQLLGYRRADLVGSPIHRIVVGGPLVSAQEWSAAVATHHFTGEVGLIAADGTAIAVQWGATTEVVTGGRLVLIVALSTSRWGRRFRRDVETESAHGNLSPRELEIIRLVARGRSGPEIADELHIAHDTVRTHVRNAMSKLGARSRAHLVARALGEGHVLS